MRRTGAVAVALMLGLAPGLGRAQQMMPPVEPPVPPVGPPVELDDLGDLEVVEGMEDLEEVPGPETIGPPVGPEEHAAPGARVPEAGVRVPEARHPPARTHDVPADDFEAEPGLAPGGYYGHGVILERAPPDGHKQIVVGSILVPLGTLATVTSAVGTWFTVPSHCAERLRGLGIDAESTNCQGVFTFNVIRTTYGALMLMSGATILALGLVQREHYRKWRHEHGMRARLEPGPAGLRLRF